MRGQCARRATGPESVRSAWGRAGSPNPTPYRHAFVIKACRCTIEGMETQARRRTYTTAQLRRAAELGEVIAQAETWLEKVEKGIPLQVLPDANEFITKEILDRYAVAVLGDRIQEAKDELARLELSVLVPSPRPDDGGRDE